jgi:hypothetical protein
MVKDLADFEGGCMAHGMLVSYVYPEFHPGDSCQLSDLESALSPYSAPEVIRLCSFFNTLREAAKFQHDERITEWMLRSAFPPELAERMLKGRNASPRRFVFHRPQLLLVAKTAARACQLGGRDPIQDAHPGTLSDAFLMANELLRYDLPTESDQELESNVLVNFAAIADYMGQSLGNLLVRSYVSTDILELYRKDERFREFFDLPAMFESDLHITIPEYRAATLASLAKYVMLSADDVILRDGSIDFVPSLQKFALKREWFGGTLSDEKLGCFLADCSCQVSELATRCQQSSYIYDFTPFRQHPLFQIDESYYPVDVGFIADKMETGPFWHVQRRLTGKKAERSLSFWARIFERYVAWVLENSVDGKRNIFVPNPCFLPKKHNDEREVCDGVIQCGIFAVLIECKGGFFDRHSKYSGKPEILHKTIEEKLIKTEDGSKKGIQQLASSINLLFSRNGDEAIRDLDLGPTKWIYPMLVVREPLVDAPGVNQLLNREFNKLIDRRQLRVKVESLFCLSAADLEGIAPLLSNTRITDILDARKAGDKNLVMPFALALDGMPEEKTHADGGCIAKKFKEIMGEVAKQLFPSETQEL